MEGVDVVLKMSLSGSVLYLIILLFKPITKKVFSATWNYYILSVVLLIFILPLGFFIKTPKILEYKVPINMESVSKTDSQTANINIRSDEKNAVNNNEQKNVQRNSNIEVTNSNVENKQEPQTFLKNYSKEVFLYVWLAGIVIFATKEIIICISFTKKLRRLSDIVEKEDINKVLEICKKELNINRKITIKECSNTKSPMITGIASPVITIPQMECNKKKLEIIFKHELIHYKRKDLWIKIIGLIVNIINWFNPLVYILRNNLNIACELSIDEMLVKNMDKDKRKDYAKVILEFLENSKNKSLVVGTALFNDKKELENRLKKIMYFKKSRTAIMFISILTATIFTAASIFTSTVVFASKVADTAKSESIPAEFAVYVGEGGLYMSDLKGNNPVALDVDKAQNFAQPLISRDGGNVAYIKNDMLYICNIEKKEIQQVSNKAVESYDFNSKNDLIYSTEDTGILSYDAKSKKSVNLISNEYKYYNIKCDSKDKIYASKRYEHKEDKNTSSKSLGIISYDLNDKSEKTILEGKEGSQKEIEETHTNAEILESLGSTPNIAKISTDDKYLYIWNGPKSGSAASDINQFVVYDTINNKLIDFTGDTGNGEGIYGLHYDDNISQNPLNSDIVALNEGINRDMFDNKNLGIADIKANKFVKLLPENQVSMTPCYSNDGKDILYSGSSKLDGKLESAYKDWRNQPHNIYEINTETQKITQITNGKYFDFMPKYLLDDEMLFVRGDGDSFSLWKTKDGNETKVGDKLHFTGRNIPHKEIYYYGHYETKLVIDVFVK